MNKFELTRLLKHIMWHIWIIGLLGRCCIYSSACYSNFLMLHRVCSLVIPCFCGIVSSGCVWVVCLITFGLLFFIDNGMTEVHAIVLREHWIHRRIWKWSLVDVIRSNDNVGVFHYETVSLAHIQLYERLLVALKITRLQICTGNHIGLLVESGSSSLPVLWRRIIRVFHII